MSLHELTDGPWQGSERDRQVKDTDLTRAPKESLTDEPPNCLSLGEYFDRRRLTPLEVAEAASYGDRPGPALCSQGCIVDLHDRCTHGCPSVLLTLIEYDYRL